MIVKLYFLHWILFVEKKKQSEWFFISRPEAHVSISCHSHFCSISFISSGGIFSLSTCSLTTLAHFCKESKAVQGFDISTASITRVSFRERASRENLSSPLWYRSPSKIHTLHLVWSTKTKEPILFLLAALPSHLIIHKRYLLLLLKFNYLGQEWQFRKA